MTNKCPTRYKYENGRCVSRKKFYMMDNVGRAKYTVNFYDGKKKHSDGSEFYDIEIFKNKRKRDDFVESLIKDGYTERGWME